MNTPEPKAKRVPEKGSLLRRCHRWIGITVAVFVLLLSCTGIALNHGGDWKLDDRYVAAPWLLDAYGVHAPSEYASFVDRESRVTLLGQRLYLGDREIAESFDALTGMTSLITLVLVTSRDRAFLFTADGELVEDMDLSTQLPEPVERVGRAGERAVVVSGGLMYRTNADITAFELWADSTTTEVAWSAASEGPASLLKSLKTQYRGRGLSLERFIADIHSGRVVSIAGPFLMDAVAILLIILSLSGLLMWLRPRKTRQGP
ncbi:MAG: PepSY domain-containing protein [Proteobacteria bacterium]|nr:PepSY domain-containing protein [Pseudomonadota bacterium]